MPGYFEIITEQNKYDLDKQCNRVDYTDANYLICQHNDGTEDPQILALFPHSVVLSVIKRGE